MSQWEERVCVVEACGDEGGLPPVLSAWAVAIPLVREVDPELLDVGVLPVVCAHPARSIGLEMLDLNRLFCIPGLRETAPPEGPIRLRATVKMTMVKLAMVKMAMLIMIGE